MLSPYKTNLTQHKDMIAVSYDDQTIIQFSIYGNIDLFLPKHKTKTIANRLNQVAELYQLEFVIQHQQYPVKWFLLNLKKKSKIEITNIIGKITIER